MGTVIAERSIMKYLLLVANAPDAWADAEAGADDGVDADWDTYTRALAEAGMLVTGGGLAGPETATTVRRRDGRRLVSDGPFAETKEHLIGFYVIDVPDLDAALDWAARVPNVRTGSTEVRPLPAELTTEASLGRSAAESAAAS